MGLLAVLGLSMRRNNTRSWPGGVPSKRSPTRLAGRQYFGELRQKGSRACWPLIRRTRQPRRAAASSLCCFTWTLTQPPSFSLMLRRTLSGPPWADSNEGVVKPSIHGNGICATPGFVTNRGREWTAAAPRGTAMPHPQGANRHIGSCAGGGEEDVANGWGAMKVARIRAEYTV